MARAGKDPKPYTQKCRRGERPYQYSEAYMQWRKASTPQQTREANAVWAARFAPNRNDRPRREMV